MTAFSNKSEKHFKSSTEREDMFTEMRNKGLKEQMSSKVESVKENPERPSTVKTKEKVRVAKDRIKTLKKDQKKLKGKL